MIKHRLSSCSTNATLPEDQVPENLFCNEEYWEFELEVIGGAVSLEQLEKLLERAPNPESATAQFLMGYLASHANHQI